MRQCQKILETNDICSYRRYLQQMFVIVGVLLFSLGSESAFARQDNPGLLATCTGNSVKGIFDNSSSNYANLKNSFDTGTYQSVTSTSSSLIPLKIKMSILDVRVNNSNNNTTITGTSAYPAIDINRNFIDQTSRSDITLDFQNGNNGEITYLDKVALSVFDIDRSLNSSRTRGWDDFVRITGVTKNNTEIKGTFQNVNRSIVTEGPKGGTSLDRGLKTSSTRDLYNCRDPLQTDCQGSVLFDDPVKSVTISYSNTETVTDPTTQRIQFSLDSYCYLPPPSYSITKDDEVTSIGTNNITNYIIKVTNTGGSALQNILLKDPAVTGLSKQSGITCDTADTTNTCTTPPTVNQLEQAAGFTIPSLPVGRSYTIKVPTRVTASEGTTVINRASIKTSTLNLKEATDENKVTSIFGSGSSSTPATCPAKHKMYYLVSSRAEKDFFKTKALGWTPNGSTSQTFSFGNEPSGNKTFKIDFPLLLDINSTGNTPPFYAATNAVGISAINLQHNSVDVKTNHYLDISVNRPVSKIGYKIQDVDSTINNGQVPYAEEVDVSRNNGQLTFSDIFHTINPNRDVVTAINGLNCSVVSGANECTIDATWNYTPAKTPLRLEHKNTFTQYDSYHAVGYSDFYFCLAPPKVVVKKVLVGNRVNNTDQFNIKVSGGILTPDTPDSQAAFTTTGTGNTVSNATTSVLTLAPTTSYTITERVLPETNGNINNYSASYECTNATTDSSTPMPKGNGNSFPLSNLDYGDEITCIITNTANAYTFTGFVFNDNGGITARENTRQDISSTFTNNANYFNGIFDTSGNNTELGIGASGLQVRLTNCGLNGGTDIAGTVAQSIPTPAPQGLLLGQYKFTVPASALASLSSRKVCVVQVEPIDWEYSVDTTTNSREVILVDNIYNYSNIDFGEVKSDNASLVLIKSQYVNNCDINANYDGTTGTSSQTPVFSVEEITGMVPGKCIAYRIDAYNRGHVDLKDVQISDKLQTKAQGGLVDSIFAMPLPKGVSPASYNGPSLPLGTITSNIFNLNKSTGATATKATLYFNTKYGTTNSAP